MSKVIALAGKGGVGKTTVAALLVRHLTKNGASPVLAVDADPNSNLGETLGIKVDKTVGDVREDFMKNPQGIPSGMDKIVYLEMLINQVIIEQEAFDLLVMGRQEGQGCYCMVNNILNRFTEELEKNYKYLMVDNEAGMEHLSRRTSGKVDMLLLVTDYALRGLRAVGRINSMLSDLKLTVGQVGLIVNRAPETLGKAFLDECEKIGIPIVCTIPDDTALLDFDMEGRSLMDLPDDSLAVKAVDGLMDTVLPAVKQTRRIHG
ncbi:AcsF [Desulforapulum autotrophicum HRM2]|uniref:AcsF n=1 Tax=Desulforapulum autotrophicum (strain ATCC 43914 / DSM 3382 / VKM B-1955 / HRM2) TaxID=177437 RepID=C0QAY5_DESAH|nr:AAA family ATPase [Desulforapulum autotrophicum]ACN14784.1 AcsF [Desulforapulum autotrophicum HRM2]